MPCICDGAITGLEEIDTFLLSDKGREVMEHLSKAASLIESHRISRECDLNDIEFRQVFVKYFLHILVGCDEVDRPKANQIDDPVPLVS